MKIAFVCGHYIPEVGYLETHLTLALAKLGYQVKVFTTTIVPSNLKKVSSKSFKTGEEKINDQLTIQRLRPFLYFNQIVLATSLTDEVIKYKPDLIIVAGLTKLFPNALIKKIKGNIPIATLIGNNSYNDRRKSHKAITRLISSIGLNLKTRAITNAVNNSTKLFLYTIETESFIKKIVPTEHHKVIEQKKEITSLGFNEDLFYYDSQERDEIREGLGIANDETVIITSTRIEQIKNIESVLLSFDQINQSKVHYIIIGMPESKYGEKLKLFVNQLQKRKNIHLYPFSTAQKIRQFYNASDIGIWTQPSISAVEAKGTGLRLMLKEHDSIMGLIDHETDWTYTKENLRSRMELAIAEMQNSNTERGVLANKNKKKFSFTSIANQLVKLTYEF